jgi:amino acid adenylation domain-containing protein
VRDLSRPPLFQVVFALQNMAQETLELPALRLSRIGSGHVTTKFDLSLFVREVASRLQGYVEYATDLFDGSTIARLVGHFERLLAGIVADPSLRLSELPLLGDAERHRLLVEWNATAKDYPADKCLHELFSAQAAKTPEAVAVVYEERQLSYGELDRRSNQLAHHLRGLGVGPEVVVGLCVERSLEIVVGLLGILKAGGAYLPLDPGYPSERLAYMLADAKVPVLVTQTYLLDQFWTHEPSKVWLDADWPEIAAHPVTAPANCTVAENLAYVLYTSGSTGKPKGVSLQHTSAVAMLSWAGNEFSSEDTASTVASTSICFDLSVFELFVPLSKGGKVILANSLIDLPAAAKNATLINTVPSAIAELIRQQNISRAIRVINLAGEPLQSSLVQRLYNSCNVQSIYNLYGPSEDTTYSTYALIGRSDTCVPIGRPISNTRVYVLDSDLHPLPIGAAGELYIGGVGLARGYLGRAGLTADRFIPNPFADGERLYRTGDLVRYLADGNLEFLGRLDYQVKIRGYRIELGETEASLVEHPGVGQAVVVAREDVAGDKRLVAYVVATDAAAVDAGELRAHLQRSVPGYMVPAAFVVLEALPLTPNGKVDRRALPAPEADAVVHGEYVPPRTPAEEVLAGIWAEVLKLDRVGVNDNFFELGGHSLLATRVIARVRNVFAVELALRTLFEAPTVRGLAERIEEAQRGGAEAVLPALEVQPRDAPLPLSYAQERLWFLDQLGVGSAYNIPAALRLEGALDIAALERSIGEALRRHESLRTRFEAAEGRAIQVIEAPGEFRLEVVDLSDLEEAARQGQARRLAQEDAARPFDLAAGALFRAKLVRLSATEHVALVNMHHIVSDGWSLGVLIREVGTLYGAYVAGLPSPLAELPVQYADYTLWQRGWLAGERLEQQVAYWKEQLAGAPAALELPTDRGRPAVQSFAGASYPFALSPELSSGLLELSRREGVTLYMVLVAAFSVLLGRYSGQRDIVVGSPIAGRRRHELEGLIGFFVNTLVLRTDLSGDPTFRDLLQRVKDMALGAYAHQDLPFEKLVKELQPVRDLSRPPLFQVVFALQNMAQETLELPALRLSPIGSGHVTTKFDLSLFVREVASRLQGYVEYATDLFDGSTIARLVGHFERLLAGIVADPSLRLSELPRLGEAERHRLLVEWNATAAEYPRDKCLHELFAAQAAKTPAAIAVVYEDQQFSYRELDRRSNQLAHHLRGLGVGPEVVVGLCVERSLEMVVGLLGILKAGGAYLPLDPGYPQERLAYMLCDAHVPVLVTQGALVARLPVHEAQMVQLDADCGEIAAQPDVAPASGAQPDNLAYVIYTSGSTGKPKGAMITHGGVLNYLNYTSTKYDVIHRHSAIVSTPLSFDATVTSLFTPLMNGQAVCLLPKEDKLEALASMLAQEGKSWLLKLTPAHLEALRQALPAPAIVKHAWSMVIGGEALVADTVRPWREHARLFNEYGPTETVVGCAVYEINAETPWTGAIPIGRPISNTRVYVLDGSLEAVPIGVAGELFIGGAGLARGYLGRADLTAERFVPHPYGEGERLYRTGDLVRYLADGNLEFLGRIDHQVKVRGYRIELGEIEAGLLSHAGVAQAVVVAREDEPGDKRLVAYVVGSGTTAPDVSALRSHLQARLPEYMAPSSFVVLDALPLTPNGKVDRRALPALEVGEGLARQGYVAPRTPAEEVLCGLWCEVLKVDRVGIHDNFFALGGHSLVAMQLILRVRREFDVGIEVRVLFDAAATVADMASHIRARRAAEQGYEVHSPSLRRWNNSTDCIVPMQSGANKMPLFCVHPMGGGILCYHELARHLGQEYTVYGIRAVGLLGKAPLNSIEKIAQHYLSQLLEIQTDGPFFLVGWSAGGLIALEMAHQLRKRHDKIGLLGLIDTFPPKQSTSRLKWNRVSHLDKVGRTEWMDFFRVMEIPIGARMRSRWHPFWKQEEAAQREAILALAKANNAVPVGLTGDEFKAMLAVFQANQRSLHTYEVPLFDGRVVLFAADEGMAPFQFWNAHAAGGCELVRVPGDHVSIIRPPAVGVVADRVRQAFLANGYPATQEVPAT